MNPIFVLGQQRSGSTLLQRLLNASDNVRVYGEHGGAMHYIAGAYRALCTDFRTRCHADSNDMAIERMLCDPGYWTASVAGYQTGRVAGLCRELVEAVGNPFNKEMRWGFKEVRYGMNENIVNMLLELFPRAQIVFTTRNPYTYARSIKALNWVTSLEKHVNVWKSQWESFHAALDRYPAQTRHLVYGQPETCYIDLFRWLGLDWTPERHNVLNGPHVGASKIDTVLTAEEVNIVRSITKMEPPVGFDPTTSPIPRAHSTN